MNPNAQKQRLSMLDMSKFRESYGCFNRMVVDPPSSGEETDGDGQAIGIKTSPSFVDVCENIFDIQTLKFLSEENEVNINVSK